MSGCYFYVLALAPDLKPERVKMGVANCVTSRLSEHRTAAPTARLLAFWPCERRKEREALRIGGGEARSVGGEVFDVDSVTGTIERLSVHFGTEPLSDPPKRIYKPFASRADDRRRGRVV